MEQVQSTLSSLRQGWTCRAFTSRTCIRIRRRTLKRPRNKLMAPAGNRATASVQFCGILPWPYRQRIIALARRQQRLATRLRRPVISRARPDKCTWRIRADALVRSRPSRASRKLFASILRARTRRSYRSMRTSLRNDNIFSAGKLTRVIAPM